jgi:hypothetical protein
MEAEVEGWRLRLQGMEQGRQQLRQALAVAQGALEEERQAQLHQRRQREQVGGGGWSTWGRHMHTAAPSLAASQTAE